ncbi:MAG: VWA domain-containing protein [Syntrophomonadaceae bacterium]
MKRLYALIVLLASAAAAVAQEKPPVPASQQAPPSPPKAQEAPIPPVSESVDVTITNVDVFVTDSKGNRVPGLKEDDFEINQDGIPQKITNFYAVSGGKVIFEDGSSVPFDVKEPAAPQVPPVVQAHYVFYIDNQNIQPQTRNRMFKRLKEFIVEAVGPNAEGEIVTYNRSLKVRKGFTSHANELLATIEEIELDTGGGTNAAQDRKDTMERINDAKSSIEAQNYAQSYAKALRNDIEFTVDALVETISSLAGIQGRKNLVYVSEGLPATAGLEMYEAIREKFQDPAASMQEFEYDLNSRYMKIISAANANGVTIYALDASGLQTNDSLSAENRTTDIHVNDFYVRQNMQGPIKMMAEETGGLAAVNTNDWKANLDQIASDFSNFYSLGYRAAKGASDRGHKIEVTVKRKGLTVRTRTTFMEKSIETRTAESVVASLHYARSENPLGVNVSIGDAKPYDSENYLLPVRISVPIGKLGLVPSGETYQGQFFIYFVVLDVSGKQSDLQVQRQEVKVPQKDLAVAQRKDFYYDVQLVVVPGDRSSRWACATASRTSSPTCRRTCSSRCCPRRSRSRRRSPEADARDPKSGSRIIGPWSLVRRSCSSRERLDPAA